MGDADERRLEIEVGPQDVGDRVDRVLARLAGVSRQRAMEWLAQGRVKIGWRRPRKGERIEAGTTLLVELPESETPVPQPEMPLTVLHEDPWLLALDKPAGIQMHPLVAGETRTLANPVLARFADVVGASPETRCPGLVHRLDRDTSGVVLWARRRDAFDALRAQFSERTVEKRYLALVEGIVEGEGELHVPIAHDPKDDRRMLAAPYPAEAERLQARPAHTRYRALAQGDDLTLLDVEIPTGVMHQIRVHFAFTGHPVLGDVFYGGREVEGLSRHFLHAASIAFEHPDGSGRRRIVSPLPEELRGVLRRFGIEHRES